MGFIYHQYKKYLNDKFTLDHKLANLESQLAKVQNEGLKLTMVLTL